MKHTAYCDSMLTSYNLSQFAKIFNVIIFSYFETVLCADKNGVKELSKCSFYVVKL